MADHVSNLKAQGGEVVPRSAIRISFEFVTRRGTTQPS